LQYSNQRQHAGDEAAEPGADECADMESATGMIDAALAKVGGNGLGALLPVASQ
jgi:hypothetical protein